MIDAMMEYSITPSDVKVSQKYLGGGGFGTVFAVQFKAAYWDKVGASGDDRIRTMEFAGKK